MQKRMCTSYLALPSLMGILLFFVAIALLSVCAVAATTEQPQQVPEGKFIQGLSDKANGLNVDTGLTQAQLDSQYRDMLHNAFDIQAINQYVIGRTWEEVTPDQKREYLRLFKEFVFKTYGRHLRFHAGEGFHVNSIHRQNEKDAIVSTEIKHSGGTEPTPVDWIVRHKSNGKLAIVDVIVDGVSLNANQRDEFASILASNGNDFNSLLDALRHKAQ